MGYRVHCTRCDLDRTVSTLENALEIEEHHQDQNSSHVVELHALQTTTEDGEREETTTTEEGGYTS